MELRLNNTPSNLIALIGSATKQFIAPFTTEVSLTSEAYIMPIKQVLARLHEHYIQQLPVRIVYEYYDRQDRIHQTEKTVYIQRLQANERFVCVDCDSELNFILSIEQILRVESCCSMPATALRLVA